MFRYSPDGHTAAEGRGKKKHRVILSGEVEFDEVYIVAGHKGNPVAVADKGREGRRNRLRGARGRVEHWKKKNLRCLE